MLVLVRQCGMESCNTTHSSSIQQICPSFLAFPIRRETSIAYDSRSMEAQTAWIIVVWRGGERSEDQVIPAQLRVLGRCRIPHKLGTNRILACRSFKGS
jgi:hypothetical protein